MSKYVTTPETISFSVLANKSHTLSPSVYKSLCINNSNVKSLRDFLSRSLSKKDFGQDVGSINYIQNSTHHFMRTKALQSYSFIPEFNSEALVPIFPNAFIQINLQQGDIIISKDSNIGEIVILDEDYPNVCLSGALCRLPINKYKYYVLALVKHPIVREQLDFMVPKGATIRHAKTLFLDCLIPIPNYFKEQTITYVEHLTRAIIAKEKAIKLKYNQIINLFDEELSLHQNSTKFTYSFPKYNELLSNSRLDAKIYSYSFRELDFRIRNYIYGTKSIFDLGFEMSRGQNLQVSNIGESIYSTEKYDNFYSLILPKFISVYGIPNYIEYLGNPHKLKTLKKGDLIFGAEGFEKGRSIVIIEDMDNYITNIHGITITHASGVNINESIFLKCYLDFLRKNGMIESFAVGGNGGSFAQKYWDYLRVPNFPNQLKNNISKLYYSGIDLETYSCDSNNPDSFIDLHNTLDSDSGIVELYKSKGILQHTLNNAIQNIIEDKRVDINYNILSV